MKQWLDALRYNPIPCLLDAGDQALSVFVKRDLLDEPVAVQDVWQLKEPQRILKRQQLDGSWKYPAAKENIRSQEDYNQIETYRNLGVLVEQFGFTRKHPAIQNAAQYLFSYQTAEGDFRGIYGNQYSPNYTAGITELLIKAGYEKDAHIRKVFQWLLAIRQQDGGWAIPLRTIRRNLDAIFAYGADPIQPDVTRPSSHMVTGVVLRAFAAHPTHRTSAEARQGGELLVQSLFKRDKYPDRSGADFWLRFSFPFWFTDLISALDSLSLLGFSKEEPQIARGLAWFRDKQRKNGMWELHVLKGRNREILELWLALAICRIFKRFYSMPEGNSF